MMTKKDADYMIATIENEGFHYCFNHYSDFSDIKDERFHELREAYLQSVDIMNEYLEECSNQEK